MHDAQGNAALRPETATGARTLKARILRAGSWTLVAHLLGQILRLASSLVMTRLLAPEMFGVLAIATMVQVILSLLSDIGLRQTVIQSQRGESAAFLDTAWTIQVTRGWLIWLVCLLVAAALYFAGGMGLLPAGSVYAAPNLPAVLAVSSFAAAINGFQSTKLMTTNRELDLRWGVSVELISHVAGLIISVLLGWLTRSIWSFVAGALTTALVSVLLSQYWLPGRRNVFAWDRSSMHELIGYGRWVLLSSLLYVLASNGDRMLLGGWFDAATVGIYGIALNLATMIEGAGSRLFASVAMPALSEVVRNDPQRLRAVLFRMRLPFDVAFIASAGALYALGPLLVDLMYDDRYLAAGQMLQWLSFGLIFARYGLAGSAYLALGTPQSLMWVHVVKLLSIFCLVPLLYSLYGLPGALIGIACHAAPTLPLVYFFNRKHGLNDLRFELAVLLAWPLGYALGESARAAMTWLWR